MCYVSYSTSILCEIEWNSFHWGLCPPFKHFGPQVSESLADSRVSNKTKWTLKLLDASLKTIMGLLLALITKIWSILSNLHFSFFKKLMKDLFKDVLSNLGSLSSPVSDYLSHSTHTSTLSESSALRLAFTFFSLRSQYILFNMKKKSCLIAGGHWLNRYLSPMFKLLVSAETIYFWLSIYWLNLGRALRY